MVTLLRRRETSASACESVTLSGVDSASDRRGGGGDGEGGELCYGTPARVLPRRPPRDAGAEILTVATETQKQRPDGVGKGILTDGGYILKTPTRPRCD